MSAIKAIETRYKGYRFRSRLEARWAVFFDSLGIDWQYEPEGFTLPDGTRYLPDFHLPTFDGGLWVEVKPTNEGWEKATAFCAAGGGRVWLAHGEPGNATYDVLATDWNSCGQGPRNPPGVPTVLEGNVPLASQAMDSNRMYYQADSEFYLIEYEDWLKREAPKVWLAREAARSARFEFGQSGPA